MSEQSLGSLGTVHTRVMAKKEFISKWNLAMAYRDHWGKRMRLVEEQIREHVDDPYCEDDIPLAMADKKLYLELRDKWLQFFEFIDAWRTIPSAGFTPTEDRKYATTKALIDLSTGRTIAPVPIGKYALKRALMIATQLLQMEQRVNNHLRSWADQMTGWLTYQEKGQWLMNYLEQGVIPGGNWYDELDFDFP